MNLVGSWLGCREGVEGMVSQGGPAGIIDVFSPHEDLPVPTDAPYRAAGRPACACSRER